MLCRYLAGFMVIIFAVAITPQAEARLFSKTSGASTACDGKVAPLTTGYGANGPYATEQMSLDQAAYNEAVQVFLPKGMPGKLPVIFFTHGYGPNKWEAYQLLIDHLVSRGMIVVFAPFPMFGGSMDNRYDKVWNGFELASQKLADRMDLTRVGFIGHSFGGGATPAMAYKGFVGNGWGSNGAFLMEFAPWYSYQISPEQLKNFPRHVMHVVQVYDEDTANDHRMAIDLHHAITTPVNLYLMVHTLSVDGCEILADHSLPGRSESIALKQYGLFRPLDALVQASLAGGGEAALATIGSGAANYHPLELIAYPSPDKPESHYMFKWSGDKNPRR